MNFTRSTDPTARSRSACDKRAFMHAIDERLLKDIVVEIVKLHVDARPDRHAHRILGRCSDVMDIVETPNRAQIGEHETLKSPLIAQNLLQQKRVGRDRDAIDLVIGSHRAHGVPFAKGRLKPAQHDHAQLALAHVHGRSVGSAFGRAVAGKVLGLGNHRVVGVKTLSLCTAHVSQAHLSGQVGVFAKVLFNASPARIARKVQTPEPESCPHRWRVLQPQSLRRSVAPSRDSR